MTRAGLEPSGTEEPTRQLASWRYGRRHAPGWSPAVRQSHALDVLERDLDDLSAGQARLTAAQREVVRQLRARQVE